MIPLVMIDVATSGVCTFFEAVGGIYFMLNLCTNQMPRDYKHRKIPKTEVKRRG